MRTAILALILAVPVSLTADLIGVVFGKADASPQPCVEPVHAVPEALPPAIKHTEPVKRPSRHKMRTV